MQLKTTYLPESELERKFENPESCDRTYFDETSSEVIGSDITVV